jgi:hypothetical protein
MFEGTASRVPRRTVGCPTSSPAPPAGRSARRALHRTPPHRIASHRTALARRLPFTAALVLVLLRAGVATRALWTPAA